MCMAAAIPCYNCSVTDKGPICKKCTKEPHMTEDKSNVIKEVYNHDIMNGKHQGNQLCCQNRLCWGVVKLKNTGDGRCSNCIEQNQRGTVTWQYPIAVAASSKASSIASFSSAPRVRSRSPVRRAHEPVGSTRTQNMSTLRETIARGKALIGSMSRCMRDMEEALESLANNERMY